MTRGDLPQQAAQGHRSPPASCQSRRPPHVAAAQSAFWTGVCLWVGVGWKVVVDVPFRSFQQSHSQTATTFSHFACVRAVAPELEVVRSAHPACRMPASATPPSSHDPTGRAAPACKHCSLTPYRPDTTTRCQRAPPSPPHHPGQKPIPTRGTATFVPFTLGRPLGSTVPQPRRTPRAGARASQTARATRRALARVSRGSARSATAGLAARARDEDPPVPPRTNDRADLIVDEPDRAEPTMPGGVPLGVPASPVCVCRPYVRRTPKKSAKNSRF